MRRSIVVLAATVMALILVPARAFAAGASIDVFPVPAVYGHQLSVVGHGFCASAGCSAVDIGIDGQTVATGIKVAADGGFTTSFSVGVVPGDHDVTAVQHTPSGDQSATAHLIVLPADNRNTPPASTKTTSSGGGTAATNTPNGTQGSRSDQQPSSGVAAAGSTSTSSGTAAWWLAGLVVLAAAAAVGLLVWRARRAASV
jgi:hypothetical protein